MNSVLQPVQGLALVFAIFCSGMVMAADGLPVAPVRNVTDDYHGTRIVDPYRYFESLRDPEVQAWIKAQAAYAQQTLQAVPGRDRLLQRLHELDAGAPYHISIVRRWPNGDLHYLKTMADENLAKLYFREAKGGQERLLINPERFAKSDHEHYALSFCCPSPDGKYIAYGIAASGSEQTVLRVLDVAAGKDLDDVIERLESDYTPPCWLADGSGFVYSRRRQLPADAPATEVYKQSYVCIHRLGSDPERDPVILRMNSSSAVPLAETDFPSIVLTQGSEYAIGKIKHGDANELTLYAAPATSLNDAAIPWKKVCDVPDEVTDFAVHDAEIYLLTAKGAPRHKVVRTSLRQPDFATAELVVPPTATVVREVATGRDALYVSLLEGGLGRIARIPYGATGEREPIELPADMPSGSLIAVHPDCDGALLATRSWTQAGRIYSFDPNGRTLRDTGLRPRGKFDDSDWLESAEVEVASHDGVRVPLSIVHKKGLALDGSHPTLVSGYGAYGFNISMRFSPMDLAWLERGGVLAFAHVRGGGEYGREWHLAGRKATKPNTWKDFIACCEYLVQKGYTSPAKLAGKGTSAGGILIGRAITERPDLFAAAIIEVGCLDMLRFETTTNGVPNIPELGTVKIKEEFAGLLAMSPYHHVKDGVPYPAVLLAHGINDPRVEPWMSAKMTARLQAATTSGKPVLFRVDYQAGHGIGSTKKQHQEKLADEWAFLLWQMGEREFQKE